MSAWIKLEVTTPDKPEVIAMAAELRKDPDLIVGKLVRLWVWADANSVDGEAISVTEKWIDRHVGCKNFAAAMRSVGWLSGEDLSLGFPGFERHNGNSAKARAETNRRVAKHRAGNGKGVTSGAEDVTGKALQIPLPEKEREIEIEGEKRETREEPESPPSPPVSPDDGKPSQRSRTIDRLFRCFPDAPPELGRPEASDFSMVFEHLAGQSEDDWQAIEAWFQAPERIRGRKLWPRDRAEFLARYFEAIQKIRPWWRSEGRKWWSSRNAPRSKPPAPIDPPDEDGLSKEEALKFLREESLLPVQPLNGKG